MNKKTSSVALLDLPDEHQARAADWLLGGLSDSEVRDLCKKEFGADILLSSFRSFWEVRCPAAAAERRSRAAGLATGIVEKAAKHPAQFDRATLESIKQKAFEMAIAPGADPRNLKILFDLLLGSSRRDLAVAKLKLDREKLRLALRKHKDHVESQKKKIKSTLASASSPGPVTRETLDRVAEELNLL